jgi:uncharacterized protein (DUF2147 family)
MIAQYSGWRRRNLNIKPSHWREMRVPLATIEKWIMKFKSIMAVASAMLIGTAAYPALSQTTPPPGSPKPTQPTHSASPSPKPAAHTGPPTTAAGFWAQVGSDGKVGGWFYFLERNGVFEGRLVKMFKQPGETQIIETCERCEGDQKGAAMLGLTIVKGMRRDGYKYQDGSILDPRDGSVYHAQMEMSPDGQKLYVRGYLMVPLLGQTQTWQRLPDNAIATSDIPPESHAPNGTSE